VWIQSAMVEAIEGFGFYWKGGDGAASPVSGGEEAGQRLVYHVGKGDDQRERRGGHGRRRRLLTSLMTGGRRKKKWATGPSAVGPEGRMGQMAD
jgi:hypothetical protein